MPETDDKSGDWWKRELSFEEIRANARVISRTPYGIQDGNGVDVTLFESQLRLSPEQRIEMNDGWARHAEGRHRAIRRT